MSLPEWLIDAIGFVRTAASAIDAATSRLPRLLARVVLRLAAPLVAAGGEHITEPVADEAIDSAANVTSSTVLGYLLVWYLDAVAGYGIQNVAYGVVVSGFGSLYLGIASVSALRRAIRSERLNVRRSQATLLWGTDPGVDLENLLTPTERRSQRIERSVVLSVGFVVFVTGFLMQVVILSVPPIYAEITGTSGSPLGTELTNGLLLFAAFVSFTTVRFDELADVLFFLLAAMFLATILIYGAELFFGAVVAELVGLSAVLAFVTVGIVFALYQVFWLARGLARVLTTPLSYER